jgi:putative dimethyl sulfoxide reductase chaperone
MNDTLTQQLSRVNFYALTARILMKEVDEATLKSITDDESALSFFPNFASWEVRSETDNDTLISHYLDVDFANLFLLHLIPYESFYTREDQMLETGGDNPVVQFYNTYDFRAQLDVARAVSADHIGIELEFMYRLCQSEYEAMKNNDSDAVCTIAKIEQQFMREHLLQWAPMYLTHVMDEAGTPFYHDAASLALEFLLTDYEELSERLVREGCEAVA